MKKTILVIGIIFGVSVLVFGGTALLSLREGITIADAIVSVFSVVLAISTIAYLIETRTLRLAQTRPVLVVRIMRRYENQDQAGVRIENLGNTAARQVRLIPTAIIQQESSSLKSKSSSESDSILKTCHYQVVSPGDIYEVYSVIQLPIADRAIHAFDVQYKDSYGRIRKEAVEINLAGGQEWTYPDDLTLGRIAKSLESIEHNQRYQKIQVGGLLN